MFLTETEQLQSALQPIISAENAYLIELSFKKSKYGHVVEVFIDTETGVSSELCADLSRKFNPALEQFEFLQGKYNLVVSSPGLDRPLKFPRQYPKHKNRELIVEHNEQGAPVTSTGILTEVTAESIRLQLKNEETKEISFGDILTAKVKPKW